MQSLRLFHQCIDVLQGIIDSLAALLTPMAHLLSPTSAVTDPKGVQQGTPVLLLLDSQLTDLPFEWLPQLKIASAVVRDFSLHVQHSRMAVAASRQVCLMFLVCKGDVCCIRHAYDMRCATVSFMASGIRVCTSLPHRPAALLLI